MEPIHIIRSHDTYVRKFRMSGRKTTFKFNSPPTGFNELDWIKLGFSLLVEEMKRECTGANDYLGFTLKSLNLKNKEPGYIAFRPAEQVNDDVLWEIFGGIIQSNEESITSSDTFTVECTRVSLPVGSGGHRRSGFFNNFSEECRSRTGIVTIKNIDNLCLARALVVGKAYAKNDPLYKAIRQDRCKRQTLRAEKLLAKARVQIPSEGAGIKELEKLQAHLKKYKITVYNYNTRGREIYFSGDNADAKMKINLLFNEGHFNVITSLTSAFACKHYCEACHIGYEKLYEHRCSSLCSACMVTSPPCNLEHDGVICPDCNRHFKNQTCFIAHQSDVCSSVKKCRDCNRIVRPKGRTNAHVCGEQFCRVCLKYMHPNHKCFMRVDTGKPKSKNFLFIFFDLETRQDENLQEDPEKKLHIVNLCVSQQYCWQCISRDDDDITPCESCTIRQRVFKVNPIAKFMDYVMEVRKKFESVCVIAHNGQGFDFQFLLKYIYRDTKFSPKLISRGTKIILMECDNVRFVDSINYFPMALANLPKSFDLGPEKKKGYFPHLFNTLDNQNYVGPIPDKMYYCPDSMFKKGYEKFTEWYNEQVVRNYTFDFQKEILEYCISDVEILAKACIKFRTMFLKECNVDPFLEAVTIASACNLAFRRNFLKPSTIGIIPTGGYRLADNQSAKAIQWMAWEEEKRHLQIQHAGNSREFKIPGIGKVDGFDGERVYEFQGCYFHGCPKCFPYKREEHLQEDLSDSLHLRYERTKERMERIREQFDVVEMWECEFDDLKKKNKLQYLNSLPSLNTIPLNPRDAFYGGRTGNSKTYYKCDKEEGEKIYYVDICSLYPWVCKYGKFPIGHPTIFVGNEECLKRGMDAEGLLKCKILPPTDLYHPVLPLKMNNKLMFVLCRMCGENVSSSGECQHGVEERALVGTWTMNEIRKAVEKGYVILERYELWQYEMATIENGGLFTDFIDKFLKMKQESSGYPSWCKTDEEKERYVKDYFDHEGILLDPKKIEKNEGMRSLSKLMLNSFWGKFGQRENQTKTTVTRDPKELFNLLVSPSDQVNRIKEVNEEVVVVNWQHLEEVGECLRTVNVVLAAFTTSQARLKLYEHLEKLGKQVCYYDTDSVIYVHRPGLYKIPVGDYLGDMTDELAKDYGPGSFIVEFCSGGPKTYGYIAFSTDTNTFIEVCKIKGLTLNLSASKKLNFSSLKAMILSEESISDTVVIKESRIRRTEGRDIITVIEKKDFRITGPKRKRDGDHDTLPHGYKKQRYSEN